LINTHVMGESAIGNPNISAIYLDDSWQTFAGGESPSPIGGPTEVGLMLLKDGEPYDGVIDDLGFDAGETHACCSLVQT
jgi:hypothetical protein